MNYDQKEFDAFTQGLMKQFQKEFKDSVQAIENIPKGTILVSAIKACLHDEKKQVKTGILDTMNNIVR